MDTHCNREAILSTNASGIPLASIPEGFSVEFHRSFLETHFFDPPLYLHLMELIRRPIQRFWEVEEFPDHRAK